MRLTETAIMIALGTVLSIIKLVDLPYGGSVTVAHMLPVILIAYRYGAKWGFLSGSAYGLLQLLLGMKNLSYATSIWAGIAIIVFDYILAYSAMGIAGCFSKQKNQPKALLLGGFLVFLTRYICHVISGCTVWAGLSVPTKDALIFSVIYNATYMIPEAIVTLILGFYLSFVLDFHSEKLTRLTISSASKKTWVLGLVAGLVLIVSLIIDTCTVFAVMQDAETGTFTAASLANLPWCFLGVQTGIALLIFAVLKILAKTISDKEV